MNMGERIKDLRKKKGLTLEEVGDFVGVGKSTVRKWECGMIENIRRDKIAKLATVLGTTPDYLIGWGDKTEELVLTEPEKTLVRAYRNHPEMQNAVNTLLNISGNNISEDMATQEAVSQVATIDAK